ncbi:hypothetical protein [Sphingopyxis granuli]|uniref:hypothetical protein n=1 Tax=Sphingopyxis granuli TaxID=267128 RepID=UPI00301CD2DF
MTQDAGDGIEGGRDLVGAMSDQFSAAHGNLGLRYALLISTTSFVAGGVAFLMSARKARTNVAKAASF